MNDIATMTDAEFETFLNNLDAAIDAVTVPSFEVALKAWLEKAQEIVNAYHKEMGYYNLPPARLTLEMGRKYVRVVRTEGQGIGRSVHCFINTENGDVLKAASWKTPAKGARGNIFTKNLGVDAYGGHYNR